MIDFFSLSLFNLYYYLTRQYESWLLWMTIWPRGITWIISNAPLLWVKETKALCSDYFMRNNKKTYQLENIYNVPELTDPLIFLIKSCPRHPILCFSWHYSSWLTVSLWIAGILFRRRTIVQDRSPFCRLSGLVRLALALVRTASGARCP